MSDLTELGHALARARTILATVDREHTTAELYLAVRGAKHEIRTAQAILSGQPPPERSEQSNG